MLAGMKSRQCDEPGPSALLALLQSVTALAGAGSGVALAMVMALAQLVLLVGLLMGLVAAVMAHAQTMKPPTWPTMPLTQMERSSNWALAR